MNLEQTVERLTEAYIYSYNLAFKETHNANLAVQIAMGVIMTIYSVDRSKEPDTAQQMLLAMLAQAAQNGSRQREDPKEGGEENHDRSEDAGN